MNVPNCSLISLRRCVSANLISDDLMLTVKPAAPTTGSGRLLMCRRFSFFFLHMANNDPQKALPLPASVDLLYSNGRLKTGNTHENVGESHPPIQDHPREDHQGRLARIRAAWL